MIDFESAPSGPPAGSSSRRPAPAPGPAQEPAQPKASSEASPPEAFPDTSHRFHGEVDVPAILKNLNERQREAVLITEGPLMVLAGAGSGKTKMLTSRIAYLIAGCGVPPHRILAMTFTNKAAGEMRERVEKMLNVASGQLQARGLSYHGAWGGLGVPEIGTFHSVCVRLIRREIERTPFTKQFVIYDDSDQLSLIKSTLEKLGIDDKAFSPKGMQAGINRLKCDAVEPEEMEPEPHNIFQKQLKRVYEQYQKDLFANNALDFGEIICMAYRILRDHEDTRRKYQERFRYVHVDEYQDTNRAQYFLLSMLAGKSFGGHQNLCVVGDEDQSIYKWRGADIRNIMDFELEFPGAQVVKLEQNYRSTKTIIQAATRVIQNNKYRRDKTLWTENEDGVRIVHAQLPDERAEAEMVVSEIKRIARGDGQGCGQGCGRTFAEFAVFYRTNAQSRVFEDVLRREKITYQVVGGLRFYDRKEIKDILSYFKVVLNPADSVGLKRIINVPARGIGKTTVEKLESAGAMTFWDALKAAPGFSAGTAKKLAQFTALIERLIRDQPNLLLSELYHLILDETGYVRDLRAEGTEEAMDRIENLEELDNVLQEFEEEYFRGLGEEERNARKHELLPAFIEQSSLASDLDAKGQKELNLSSVKLMTLHSSKGLEFPVVFLVGMEEGLFPSIKAWEETPEEDIEEERRLCYVGMTRAREQLYLSNVVIRRVWGSVNYQQPSRFFAEIPENLVDLHDFSKVHGQLRSTEAASSYVPSSGQSFGQRQNSFVGRRVRHPEYGDGKVLAIEGSGADQKVVIEFGRESGRTQRKFLLRYVASFFE